MSAVEPIITSIIKKESLPFEIVWCSRTSVRLRHTKTGYDSVICVTDHTTQSLIEKLRFLAEH